MGTEWLLWSVLLYGCPYTNRYTQAETSDTNPDLGPIQSINTSSSRHVPHLCTRPALPLPAPVHHPVCRDMGRDTQRVGCGEGLRLGCGEGRG